MRLALGVLVLVPLLPLGAPAAAQPYPMPPGSYRQQCSRLYMEGQFLHGYCRGALGAGESSVNVLSCSTGVFVDDTGALACIGPGGGAPPAYPPEPGYGIPPGPEPGYPLRAATLYARPGLQGPSIVVNRPAPNLADSGLNDRVRSIRLDRAGPWLVCSEVEFGGRCVTITRSVDDTAQLGMHDGVLSVRPMR